MEDGVLSGPLLDLVWGVGVGSRRLDKEACGISCRVIVHQSMHQTTKEVIGKYCSGFGPLATTSTKFLLAISMQGMRGRRAGDHFLCTVVHDGSVD